MWSSQKNLAVVWVQFSQDSGKFNPWRKVEQLGQVLRLPVSFGAGATCSSQPGSLNKQKEVDVSPTNHLLHKGSQAILPSWRSPVTLSAWVCFFPGKARRSCGFHQIPWPTKAFRTRVRRSQLGTSGDRSFEVDSDSPRVDVGSGGAPEAVRSFDPATPPMWHRWWSRWDWER